MTPIFARWLFRLGAAWFVALLAAIWIASIIGRHNAAEERDGRMEITVVLGSAALNNLRPFGQYKAVMEVKRGA